MSKTVIKNGRILDGTGNPWFIGDIAIENRMISKIERRKNISSFNEDIVIEADGKIVCPGFIDIHSHSDTSFFKDKHASSKICQGITTEVVGNCGMSCAPVAGEGGKRFLEMNVRIFGQDFPDNLTSMKSYMDALEDNGTPLNIASLVGHSTIRASAMGYKLDKPSNDEQQTMEKLLEESLEAGAFGMSMGYQPGERADLNELVALANVVAKYDGFIASHPAQLSLRKWEGEGGGRYSELTKNIQQLLDIGEQANIPVLISHCKAIGSAGWGRACWIVDLINRFRAKGIDVQADLYGYPAGGGSIRGLFAPKFLNYDKDIPLVIAEVIQDKKTKEKVLDQIKFTIHALGEANRVKILNSPSDHSADGKTLQILSQKMGLEPSEVILHFLQMEEDTTTLTTWGMEKDVIPILKHPAAMISSDGISISYENAIKEGGMHPRNFGAFPRIIKHYVKELGVLYLEDAIRKMTSLPAERLGLKNRGKIQEGNYADLVIFDYDTIDDMATYEKPVQFPQGIEYVLVNGEIAVEKGKYKKTLSGEVLRSAQ